MEQANIRMVLDRVLVAEEPWEFRTESGILIDHASVEPPHWRMGQVLSIGPGRDTKGGRRPPGYDPEYRPQGYLPGDRVTYRRGHGHEVGDGRVILTEPQVIPCLIPPEVLPHHVGNPYGDDSRRSK